MKKHWWILRAHSRNLNPKDPPGTNQNHRCKFDPRWNPSDYPHKCRLFESTLPGGRSHRRFDLLWGHARPAKWVGFRFHPKSLSLRYRILKSELWSLELICLFKLNNLLVSTCWPYPQSSIVMALIADWQTGGLHSASLKIQRAL